MNQTEKKQNALLFLALIGAYVIAVAVLISFRTAPFIGSETDGVYYMLSARALFTESFMPPTFGGGVGMPIAIAALNYVFSDTFRSAQIVSALAGLLYLVSSVRFLSKLYAPSVGLATGLLLLVSPIFLVYSTTSLSDVLGACLPLVGLWALTADEKRLHLPLALLTGIAFGAAFAVRSINLVFLPLLLVGVLIPLRGIGLRKKTIGLMAVGLIVGGFPQVYFNLKFFGTPFHSDNWRNIAATVFDWSYANKVHSFSEFVRQAGLKLPFLWIKRFVVDIPGALYHVTFLPSLFSVPGFFLILRKTKSSYRHLWMAWGACTLVYLLLVAPVWRIELRYFLPVLPLLLAAGLALWQQLTRKHRTVFITGLAVATLMSLGATVQHGRELLGGQAVEFKEAGLYLRDRATDNENILASQPSVFFYSQHRGRLFEEFDAENLESLGATASSHHLAWIVFDERRGARNNPGLTWLLDANSPLAARLGWRAVFDNGRSPKIVVWRVN